MTAKTMTLTLAARSRCTCGAFEFTSACFPSFVVNRRSLRQVPGRYLTAHEFIPGQHGRSCPVCGFRPPSGTETYPLSAGSVAASPWRITAESQRELAEYRAKRWPQ